MDNVTQQKYQFASWPKRALALIADLLIIIFLYAGVLIIFNIILQLIFFILSLLISKGAMLDEQLSLLLVVLTSVVIYGGFFIVIAVYYLMTMSRDGQKNGQSLGKEIFSIKVIREDGQEITKKYALKRQLTILGFVFLGIVTLGAALIADYLWPLKDKKNQALHDKVARSLVIKIEE